MNTEARVALERQLRAAEGDLRDAREKASTAANKMTERVDAVLASGSDLRDDDRLSNLVAIEEAAKRDHDAALQKRDGLLRKLAENPISGVLNGHDSVAANHGIGVGFTMSDLMQARAQLLGANPAPIRLGPPRIVDPQRPQSGVLGDLPFSAMGYSDIVEAQVPSFDISVLFPYLRERPSVANMFPSMGIDTYSRWFFKVITPADQAAAVAEGDTKPLSSPQTEKVEVIPQIVAHRGVFSRQILYNFPDFLSALTSEFMAGLLLKVDQLLLSGTGDAPDLNGIINEGSVNTYWRDTTTETRVDSILGAITKVRTTAYVDPTHLVIHPNDLQATRQEKGSVGGLYTVAPVAQLDEVGLPDRLWGLQVIPTTSIPEGVGLVINPELYGSMIYRQPAILEINPYEGWDTNEYGMRCEWWGNIGCIHPQAACVLYEL